MDNAIVNWVGRILPLRLDELRIAPVGVAQREFNRTRGEYIAANFNPAKFGYPVVNRADGVNSVIDGQHRVYALKQQPDCTGATIVECECYDDLTQQQMADIFLGRNDTRAVRPFPRFLVGVSAGYPRESAVMQIVTEAKLRVSKDRNPGSVSSVGALLRVYDRCGADVLLRVLCALRDAYEASPDAFRASVVDGFARLLVRYPDLKSEDLVAALSKPRIGVYALFQLAAAYRERLGQSPPQCVAAAIVDVYNRDRVRKSRLRGWWKA